MTIDTSKAPNAEKKFHNPPLRFKGTLNIPPNEAPVLFEAKPWQGVDNITLRQLFYGYEDGDLYYGKQGFNIPVAQFERVMWALIHTFNASTGRMLSLHDMDFEDQVTDFASDVSDELAKPVPEIKQWQRRR